MSDQIERIRNSAIFDADWYRLVYTDIGPDIDPATHYLQFGAGEGRDPGPFFSTRGYVDQYPDAASPANALLHFEDRMMQTGTPELDRNLLEASELFDSRWYLTRHNDVDFTAIDPVRHYLEQGAREGRAPGPRFDGRHYLSSNPDVAGSDLNPLVHYLRYGIGEGRTVADKSANLDNGSTMMPLQPGAKTGPKAVFVTHDLNTGGAPILLRIIASWFQRCTDYDVRIVAMATGPHHADFAEVAPIHVVGTTDVADGDVPTLRNAVRDFIGEEPAFTFINSAAAGHYCKIDPFEAPIFGYVHELNKVLDIYSRQFECLMDHAVHVFCGGTEVHDEVRKRHPDKAAQLTTRPSFIPSSGTVDRLTGSDKARLRASLGLNRNRKLVTACGIAHWRKQPLLFVRLAAAVVRDRGRDVDFVWIGDGEDLPEMRRLADTLDIASHIHFVGYQKDIRPYIAATDVFALTSIEDPFPLVCLEAGLMSAPTVAFREATGFTALMEPAGGRPGGIAVPIGDEAAFADAVDRLLTDEHFWSTCARTVRSRVLRNYVSDAACHQLLLTIREKAGLKPRVSVVMPSYNSAPYLGQRLHSIASQTFKDVEILLLDDASDDDSVQILEAFAANHPEAIVMPATRNGGSVFKAWERGIHAATGDFVWIAEADDFCAPDFLSAMLKGFGPSGVRLVHGRSIPVDTIGNVAGDWNDLYLDHLSPGLWESSFCSPAASEIDRSLGRANTIVNASGVVTRRKAAIEAIAVAGSFKLAGDWAFYVAAIHGGRIAYRHDAVNYHRRHPSSVTATIEGTNNYFVELANVGALVRHLYGRNAERDAAFDRHIGGEVTRFGFDRERPQGTVPAGVTDRRPGVLYGVGDLSGGGAQMFAARFVNRWRRDGGAAVLFSAGYAPDHPAVREKIDPMIPVIGPDDIDRAGGLDACMRAYGLDVVVTGHWWADKAIGLYQEQEPRSVPWIIIMHGCYESVLDSADHFPDLQQTLERSERHCAHWVWTATKNLRVFEEQRVSPRRVSHVVNGFEPLPAYPINRKRLGIADDAVLFLLASRAIVEKGWNVSIAAFRQMKAHLSGRQEVALLLIGDGPVVETLPRFEEGSGIVYVPHTGRLQDYIATSDICLLPSWFSGESLPLVVIECLAQGKPAITSDIGMCPWALTWEHDGRSDVAGVVVERRGPDGSVAIDDLVSAMKRLAYDRDTASRMKATAEGAFRKFDMNYMIEQYDAIINSAVRGM